MRSLADRNPVIVKQALISTSGLPDILWNFRHFEGEKCLTLAQNPHFYKGPPTFPTTYGPESNTQPTEDYQGTIYVLTNDERRVFLELGQKSGPLTTSGRRTILSFSEMSSETLQTKLSSENLSLPLPSSGLAWSIRSLNSKRLGK